MDVGQLKGSVVINFGSVREAEKAIKALQGTFNKVAGDSKKLIKAADDLAKSQNAQAQAATELAKSNTQLATSASRVDAAEKARIKAHAAAEKNLVALARAERDNLNVTGDTQSALSAARRATEDYRNTVDKLGASSVEATRAQVRMKAAVDDAKNAVRDSNNNTKSQIAAYQQLVPVITQSDQATRSSVVSIDRRQKALTQAAAAEKQIMVLKRQSAAETRRGNIALNNARQALAIYRDGLSRTDITISNLNKRYEILQRSLTRASVSTTGLNSATANARSWFRSSRAAATQFGLQLQDVAVQAQMGTNALVILGQQGSQMLGFFGAGGALAGAMLAVGAAIAYVATASAEAKDTTELYLTKVKELELGIRDLNDAQKANIELELFQETQKRTRAIQERREEIASLVEQQKQLNNQLEQEQRLQDTQSVAVDPRVLQNTKDNLKDIEEALIQLRGENANSEVALNKFKKEYEDFLNGIEEGGRTVNSVSDSFRRLAKRFEVLENLGNNAAEAVKNEWQMLKQLRGMYGDVTAKTKLYNEQVALLERLYAETGVEEYARMLDRLRDAQDGVSRATKTAADEAAEYIARLKEESETLGMTRQQLVSYEIAKIAAKDSTIANKNALIEEAQAIIANMEARQKLADRLNALEGQGKGESEADKIKREWEMLKQLKGQYGDTTSAVQEYANKQQFLAEMYERTNNPEILRMMERYAEAFNNVSSGADNAAFSIMSFASNLDDIMNSQMESFTASAAGFAELFGANLSEGMQKGVVGLGAGIDSMMSLLETANRDSSTEYKRMAQMQATVAGALAITKIWGQYAAQPWIAAGLTALVAANTGAQIAAIQAANYATGGLVRGPGTGTSDDIPANLSNGEYVLRADAVRKIGVANLNAMNQGRIANFSSGGLVGGSGGGTSVGMNVQVINNNGSNVRTEEGVDENGHPNLRVLIDDIVNEGLSRGRYDRSMTNSFGVRRSGRRV